MEYGPHSIANAAYHSLEEIDIMSSTKNNCITLDYTIGSDDLITIFLPNSRLVGSSTSITGTNC